MADCLIIRGITKRNEKNGDDIQKAFYSITTRALPTLCIYTVYMKNFS